MLQKMGADLSKQEDRASRREKRGSKMWVSLKMKEMSGFGVTR